MSSALQPLAGSRVRSCGTRIDADRPRTKPCAKSKKTSSLESIAEHIGAIAGVVGS